ncbi:MAG: helix-turn-helix domain-containing protein [Oscillospiraceae bacterium]|nr:helix-turn-helix domain-containing protein [Oscillospiraceae bacterium]
MPKKQKIGAEEKVRIVREYLRQKVSISEAAREVGADFETVKMWISIYENEGVAGFTHRGMKTYTAEMKEDAVKEYLQGGGSIQSICRKYGIRDTHTFRKWIKVYNAHGNFSRRTHSGGGSYMKQGRDTTKEERLEIVKDCLASGKNYGEMALKYKVSYQQVQQPRLHKTGKESTVHSRKSP